MMVNATELRRGTIIALDNTYYEVMDFEHVTRAIRRGVIQLKLRDLNNGNSITKRISATDSVETVNKELKPAEYIYEKGDVLCFMDLESYEQLEIPRERVKDLLKLLKVNTNVNLIYCNGELLNIELPTTVELKVIATEPYLKNATVSASYKPAVLETGLQVQVPPFIEVNEIIKIDTRTLEYVERVSKQE